MSVPISIPISEEWKFPSPILTCICHLILLIFILTGITWDGEGVWVCAFWWLSMRKSVFSIYSHLYVLFWSLLNFLAHFWTRFYYLGFFVFVYYWHRCNLANILSHPVSGLIRHSTEAQSFHWVPFVDLGFIFCMTGVLSGKFPSVPLSWSSFPIFFL